jgi:hypothetical protein
VLASVDEGLGETGHERRGDKPAARR